MTENLFRVFAAWVVAGEYHLVATVGGFGSHHRALAVVAVATTATHGDYLSLAAHHIVDGGEHIHKGVGGVGVVHHGDVAAG